jgi:hypothetical protein
MNRPIWYAVDVAILLTPNECIPQMPQNKLASAEYSGRRFLGEVAFSLGSSPMGGARIQVV